MFNRCVFFSLLFSSLLSGIPVPLGFEQAHVMYVWFDALTNYLSGIHALVRREGQAEQRYPRCGEIRSRSPMLEARLSSSRDYQHR